MLVEIKKSICNNNVQYVLVSYYNRELNSKCYIVCNSPHELYICFKVLKSCYGTLYVKTI